jgi:hypothetical protein
MSWTDTVRNQSTEQKQGVVARPQTPEQHLQNAAVMYAMSGDCFREIYQGMTQAQGQQR